MLLVVRVNQASYVGRGLWISKSAEDETIQALGAIEAMSSEEI
jgi:hypothetical protein